MDGTEDRSPQDTARDGQPEAGEQQKQGLDARSAVTRIGVRVRRPVFASVTGLIAVASLIWLATAHPWTGASGAPGQTAGGHFDRDGLAFDYPADWSLSASGYQMRESTALDFIGTVPALPICTPSGEGMMGANCGVDIHPGAGQILISIFLLDGPGLHSDPINPADPSGLYGSQTYVAVGGLPAIFEDQGARSDPESLTWTLSVPGQLRQKYSIRAEIRDPGLDQMRTQVMALVASIRYDPPVPRLNPADGPRIAAIGLAKARAWNSDFNCFPSATGAAVDATVTRLPGYSDLHKSLPVTCSTEIEPVLVGLWKMTLTESWTAASDRSAGSLTTSSGFPPTASLALKRAARGLRRSRTGPDPSRSGNESLSGTPDRRGADAWSSGAHLASVVDLDLNLRLCGAPTQPTGLTSEASRSGPIPRRCGIPLPVRRR